MLDKVTQTGDWYSIILQSVTKQVLMLIPYQGYTTTGEINYVPINLTYTHI